MFFLVSFVTLKEYLLLENFIIKDYDRLEVRNMIENFGGNIARLRKEFNMSQTELAEKIGVQKQTISNIERGNRYPTFETMEKIAQVFHATPIQLFGTPKEIAVSETTTILDRIDTYDQKVQNIFNLTKILDRYKLDELSQIAQSLEYINSYFTPRKRYDDQGELLFDDTGKPLLDPPLFDTLPLTEIERIAKDLAFIQQTSDVTKNN